MAHPEGLDDSVLVGDGGRGWFKTQHRNEHRNRHHNRNDNDRQQKNDKNEKSTSELHREQTKLLSKQERNRLKRQKKKQRKQNHQNNNNFNDKSNINSSSINRSDFLYGGNRNNQNNKSKEINNDKQNIHPFTKQQQNKTSDNHHNENHRKHHQKRQGFKNYVKSSNQEELNKISAKMLKAKLSSNTELYNQLQEKLNKLRNDSFVIERRYEASTNHRHHGTKHHSHHDRSARNKSNKNEEDNNSLIDSNGKHIELITDSNIAKKLHGMDEMNETNEDDDINTLLKKERNQSGLDYNKALLRNKNMKRIMTMDNDEQFDSIDTNKLFGDTDGGNNDNKNRRKRKREVEKEERHKSLKRARLISQHKHKTNWLNSCKYCIENEDIHNNDIAHTVIYYGKYMYLAVPKQECIVDYQFCIIPNQHIKSFREGILNNDNIGASKDEQLQFDKELYSIQKILCKLFKSKYNSGVIFMETVRNLKKNYHSIIHGYPMEFEKFNFSPTYFKKSILESDVMWTTNKQIVEITKDKPLNKSIPQFMSYFYVQFGLYDGYVHIIEDETKIKQDFGPQIIAGIMEEVLFKIRNDSYNKQLERAKIFCEIFEPFKQKLDNKLQKMSSK